MKIIQDLKKDEKEIQSLKSRSRIVLVIISFLILVGLSKIIQLTILDNNDYVTESDRNRIINMPLFPSRGLIQLQDGTIIAENIVFQGIYINRKFIESSGAQIELLHEKVLQDRPKVSYLSNKGESKEKIWLVDNLNEKELAKYELYKNSLPNIKLETSLRRFLPHKNLFSHVVGHMGRITRDDEIDFSTEKYLSDSLIGKVGLERVYEKSLRGFPGTSAIEVDVFGKKIRELERILPKRPSNLTLTLDLQLQRIAREELADRRGAIIAIDPNTGYIKALVSSPDYNPNILNGSEKGMPFSKVFKDQAPFFNRVISGSYPPASTIKPFIGLLGLEEGVVTPKTIIEDKGFFQIKEDGRKYRGWKEEGHGKVNLRKAIVESSDVYFYELSSQLTVDRISSFLNKFGFGVITGIDLFNETKSTLPTRNWKLGTIGEAWFVGDTINIGIGQGYITSTPLQLVSSISAIATKGKIFKPRLISNSNIQEYKPELLMEVELEKEIHWEIIESSMVAVINSWNGTAHNLFRDNGVKIAGKTGTAQIKSLTDQELTVREEYQGVRENIKNRDHALFASYGPIPNPNLAVVVIVENGESGSAVAAPIAQKLIENYQLKFKPNE
ncbi:penicillin-binding protein 2 [Gammaproteobacteria bacterium]|nr:penicillin-binding protein 2 [Gammaproteobacteria bacterium]